MSRSVLGARGVTAGLVALAGAAQGTGLPESHLHLTGTARLYGAPAGRFDLRTDSTGRYCFRADGVLAEAGAWDGTQAWAVGAGGEARTIRGHERDLAALPWWGMTGFLRSPPFAGAVAALGDSGLRVRVGDVSARVTFAAGGGTASLAVDSPGGEQSTVYGDWTEAGGKLVAQSMVTEMAGVEIRHIQVDSVDVIAGGFACPRPPVSPARFTNSVPTEMEVRRAPTGHFLVRPSIDGRRAGWFILDTGGGPGAIAPATVRAFQLRQIGQGVVTSVRGGEPRDWYLVPNLSLGSVGFGDAPMIELDLRYLTAPLGTEIAGILGYGVLSRLVAEITPSTSTVRLYPADHEYRSPVPWLEAELVDLVPVARGRFAYGDGVFRLDIGAGGPAGGVVFHSPAVRDRGLDTLLACRPGGPGLPASATRLDWFEIGGQRLTDVPTLLWRGEQGALADPYLTGNVGLTVLNAFTLVLDYPRERFRLVPVGSGEGGALSRNTPAGPPTRLAGPSRDRRASPATRARGTRRAQPRRATWR